MAEARPISTPSFQEEKSNYFRQRKKGNRRGKLTKSTFTLKPAATKGRKHSSA